MLPPSLFKEKPAFHTPHKTLAKGNSCISRFAHSQTLAASDNTGLQSWRTVIPCTQHTVDKFGHSVLCKDVVLQIAAIMDIVELIDWVVVVEAEWLVGPLRPGALSSPLGRSACHMEVQIGLEMFIRSER